MGIDTAATQLLFAAKAAGVDFARSLMIGRQFFYPDVRALAQLFRSGGIERDAAEFGRASNGWSEEYFRLLGAKTVDSMDVSAFEGATVLHDLNAPIEGSLKERFSVVFDGGTLEHIFNFPVALRNCMEMLGQGGSFIQYGPANNFMGHGFYQFSPELLYRVFSEPNGFEVVTALLYESVRGGRWYAVADPAAVGKRVQMTNRLPTSICLIARRVRCVPVLQEPPQQSDYASGWQQPAVASGGVYRQRMGWRRRVGRFMERYLPESFERFVRTMYTTPLEAQPDCYRRLSVKQLVSGEFRQRAGGT
jgi:hypothetical protein